MKRPLDRPSKGPKVICHSFRCRAKGRAPCDRSSRADGSGVEPRGDGDGPPRGEGDQARDESKGAVWALGRASVVPAAPNSPFPPLVEVLSVLDGGESVVKTGAASLADGQAVQVAEPAKPAEITKKP